MLSCACVAGYLCQYKKEVAFQLTFNATGDGIMDLLSGNNSLAMQQQLIAQIAASCHVDPAKVHFISLVLRNVSLSPSRRLMTIG